MIDPGKYEGATDDQNLRNGVGVCTWKDASHYNGDWAVNVRHGNGVYVSREGHKYEGQWINDKKHGEGILTYKDGGQIQGTWINDRLNGLAIYKDGKDGKEETVIYKKDMLIMSNSSGVSGCDWFYVVSSIIIIVGLIVGIILGVIMAEVLFAICAVAVVYWIWSGCHPGTRYIMNATNISRIFK